MTDHHLTLKAAFAAFYKVQRDRAEDCLGDIIKILDQEAMLEADQVEKILERLIEHYSPSPAQSER